MSSTQQLALGMKGKRSSLETKWNNCNNGISKDLHILQSRDKLPYPQFHSVCHHVPTTGWTKTTDGCRAHMKMEPVDLTNLDGDWEVKSIEMIHTCPANSKRRKRNVKTGVIKKMSQAVDKCRPTAKRAGNTKQIQQITKVTTGIDMSKTQANACLHSLSHDKLEAQIGQYFWIPSMFDDTLKEDDPEGTHLLEAKPCIWDTAGSLKQFYRCCMAPSFSKHLWENEETQPMVADGAFTKGIDFKHIVLLAVAFDANNRIILLCAAAVPVEDADQWLWFHNQLLNDFPGFNVFMSDADKGIRSNAARASQTDENVVSSGCARHTSANCKEGCKGGTVNDANKSAIIKLAKQRTEKSYKSVPEEIKHVHEPWVRWLDARKDEFATYTFLNRGVRRWGKVTSGGVENANAAILPTRCEPIAHLTLELVLFMQKKCTQGKAIAHELVEENKQLVNHALKMNNRQSECAPTLEVQVAEDDGPMCRARVGSYPGCPVTAFSEAMINREDHTGSCPCNVEKEHGIFCSHVKALLLKKGISTTDPAWHNKRHHTTNCLECFKRPVPACSTAGRLEVDETMVPPEWKKSAGRPKKKRKARDDPNPSGGKCRCKACGEDGHSHKTCEKPSTEHRFSTMKKQALKWCKQQSDIQIVFAEDQQDAEREGFM